MLPFSFFFFFVFENCNSFTSFQSQDCITNYSQINLAPIPISLPSFLLSLVFAFPPWFPFTNTSEYVCRGADPISFCTYGLQTIFTVLYLIFLVLCPGGYSIVCMPWFIVIHYMEMLYFSQPSAGDTHLDSFVTANYVAMHVLLHVFIIRENPRN